MKHRFNIDYLPKIANGECSLVSRDGRKFKTIKTGFICRGQFIVSTADVETVIAIGDNNDVVICDRNGYANEDHSINPSDLFVEIELPDGGRYVGKFYKSKKGVCAITCMDDLSSHVFCGPSITYGWEYNRVYGTKELEGGHYRASDLEEMEEISKEEFFAEYEKMQKSSLEYVKHIIGSVGVKSNHEIVRMCNRRYNKE